MRTLLMERTRQSVTYVQCHQFSRCGDRNEQMKSFAAQTACTQVHASADNDAIGLMRRSISWLKSFETQTVDVEAHLNKHIINGGIHHLATSLSEITHLSFSSGRLWADTLMPIIRICIGIPAISLSVFSVKLML